MGSIGPPITTLLEERDDLQKTNYEHFKKSKEPERKELEFFPVKRKGRRA